MRTVKMIILTLLGLALVVLGVANMAPVDLYLLPKEVGGEQLMLSQVPLAAVIVVAVVVGVVLGQFLEYLRERKHRRLAEEKRREVGRLRQEVGRLSTRLGEDEGDIPELPAR